MTAEDPTTREKVSETLKMNQEPKDRLWGAIYALCALVFLVGAVTVGYSETTRQTLGENRDLGFERGAIHCMTVVVDGDRDFALPQYCQRPEVVVLYPPEICDDFFADSKICARDWRE